MRKEKATTSDDLGSRIKLLTSLNKRVFLAHMRWPVLAVAFYLSLFLNPGAAADSAPPDFSDLSERLLPAVVNIATTQEVKVPHGQPAPKFPPGSPFEEFFKDFFEKRGEKPRQREPGPRPTSLGSGFVISSDGFIV
ncbi:MAG: hypothetical protein CFH37_00385, partial [Alphaproteobacteria bacterium MarineAlpha9_Bin7]